MIIATAGHIDHGKTLLVKELTGIDTDRLPEEKRRGMSVDLGFAYYGNDDETTLGFVDVPGHERFVRNMIAGVTNIDFALLVIAADDGPMPQTSEHLEILNLLGVRCGAAVITKIDKVSQNRVREIRVIIQKLLEDNDLEGASIFPVSNLTKEGINDLLAHLKTRAQSLTKRTPSGNFRFCIDRSFRIKGAGVVATGSVHSGIVNIGDNLKHAPSGNSVRVRAIQSQNKHSEKGKAGQRCALNITGKEVDLKNIRRGDWILADKIHVLNNRLDAKLIVSKSELKPLKHWTPAHLYIGAGNVTCRVAILESRSVIPGSEAFIQIVPDEPIHAVFGDNFILRDRSASRTIGGGKIIDPFSRERGRARPKRIELLQAMSQNSVKKALSSLLSKSSSGLDLVKFSVARNLTTEESKELMGSLKIKKFGDGSNEWGFSFENWNTLLGKAIREVDTFHKRKPDIIGLDENEIEKNLDNNLPNFVIKAVLSECIGLGKLKRSGKYIHSAGRIAKISKRDQVNWEKIENIFTSNKFSPPIVSDLASNLDMEVKVLQDLLDRLCNLGLLIRLTAKRYFSSSALLELAKILEGIIDKNNNGYLDLKKFRDESGMGRNLAIEVLDFFDKAGFTQLGKEGRFIKRPVSEVSLFKRSFD